MVLTAGQLNKKPEEKEREGEVRCDAEGKAFFYTFPKKEEKPKEEVKVEEQPKVEEKPKEEQPKEEEQPKKKKGRKPKK